MTAFLRFPSGLRVRAMVCVLLLAAGSAPPVSAQSMSDSTAAVAAAIAHLADPLPLPEGRLAVDTVRSWHSFATEEERFPVPGLARAVARDPEATESAYEEHWQCLRPEGVARLGGEPCHSRQFPPEVSAVVHLQSLTFGGARAEAIVSFYWTHVQSPDRSYLTMRQFTVDLERGTSGWEVHRARLRFEGIG